MRRFFTVVVSLALVAGACGSSDPELSPEALRDQFAGDLSDSTPIVGSLSFDELGCLADALLVSETPETVIRLGQDGPTPAQASLVVDALSTCALVPTVFLAGAVDLEVEPQCFLEGIEPASLETLLVAGLVSSGDGEVSVGQLDDSLLANLVRCTLVEDLLAEIGGELSSVCQAVTQAATEVTLETLQGAENEGALLLSGQLFAAARGFLLLVPALDDPWSGVAQLLAESSQRGAVLFAQAAQNNAADLAVLTGLSDFGLSVSAQRESLQQSSTELQEYLLADCGKTVKVVFSVFDELLESAPLVEASQAPLPDVPLWFCTGLRQESLTASSVINAVGLENEEVSGALLAASVVATEKLLQWVAAEVPEELEVAAQQVAALYTHLAQTVNSGQAQEADLVEVEGWLAAALFDFAETDLVTLSASAATLVEWTEESCGAQPLLAAVAGLVIE